MSFSNDRTRNLCHWNRHFARPFSLIQPQKSCGKTLESVCRGTRESVEERRTRHRGRASHGTKVKETGATATQRAKEQEETGGSSGWVWAREVGPCVQCQVARIFSPVLRFVLLRTLCLIRAHKEQASIGSRCGFIERVIFRFVDTNLFISSHSYPPLSKKLKHFSLIRDEFRHRI